MKSKHSILHFQADMSAACIKPRCLLAIVEFLVPVYLLVAIRQHLAMRPQNSLSVIVLIFLRNSTNLAFRYRDEDGWCLCFFEKYNLRPCQTDT
jgi:hypothetical protein